MASRQSFKSGSGSYRSMRDPLPKGRLHTLHEGRLMDPSYHYTRDEIPHEYPELMAETRQHINALSIARVKEVNALNKHLGGEFKVPNVASVSPDELIEDPELRSLTINMQDPIENFVHDIKEGFKYEKKENSKCVRSLLLVILLLTLVIIYLSI